MGVNNNKNQDTIQKILCVEKYLTNIQRNIL